MIEYRLFGQNIHDAIQTFRSRPDVMRPAAPTPLSTSGGASSQDIPWHTLIYAGSTPQEK